MDAVSLVNSLMEYSLTNPLVQSVIVGAVRSIAGWIQHALEDGKIDMIDIKDLVATMVRILPQGIGLSAMGVPAVGALFSDVFVTKLAKVAQKK